MPDAQWRMGAEKLHGTLIHIGDRRYAEMHAIGTGGAVVEADVREVADDDEAGTHWAWLDTGGDAPQFAQPCRFILDMCFEYGAEVEAKRGKGRVVRLDATEVEGEAADA